MRKHHEGNIRHSRGGEPSASGPPHAQGPGKNQWSRWLTNADSTWFRYGAAILAVTCALVIDAADFISGGFRIFLVFYPFIIFATLYGGRGPGLLALALSCLAASFFWIEPTHQLAIASRADLISLAIFIGGNLFFIWICERLRHANAQAAQAEAYRENAAELARQTQIIKESEQRLSLAQKAGQVGVFDWDLLSDKLIWSPEQEELFGLPTGSFEQTYDAWVRRIFPEDEARLTAFFRDWIQSERQREAETWEYRLPHPDGQTRWITARGQLLRDAEGKPVRMVGTNQDITSRHRAEEELLLRANQLKEAQRLAHIGSWEWDPNTDIATWSEELFRIYGRDPELPLPRLKDREGYYSRESWEQLTAMVQRALETGMGYQLTLELTHPDGMPRWVSAHGEAVRDSTGNIVRLIGTVQDITESKRAEEALRASEAKFRLVADNTYDWEFWLSPSGEFLYTSPSCFRITGHTAEEFQSDMELLFRIIHPDDQSAYLHHRASVNETKTAGEMEFRVIRPDGSERWIAHGCQPVFSETRQYLGVRGGNRDITQSKRMEQQLRDREEWMRYIIQHDPTAIAVLDCDLRYIFVSNRFLKDYNFKEQDIVGKRHYEVFAELPDRWRDVHQRCLMGAIERNEDDKFQRPDGSITYNRWEYRPWYRANGKIGGIVMYTEVTTERKQAEEALRRSEAKYREFVEGTQDLVNQVDGDARLLFVNHSAETIYGCTPEASVGRLVFDFVHPDDRQRTISAFNGWIRNRIKATTFENRSLSLTGEVHDLLWAIRFHYGADGRIIQANSIARDITERKRIEIERERLLQEAREAREFAENANRAKEQFIAMLSHELRTPLTPVLATVSSLEGQLDLSAELRADMELIHRNVEMEAALIDDLLDVTRINAGKIVMHPEVVDFQACLQAALKICQSEIKAKHLNLSLSPPARERYVWADPTRLQQVFWNLLRNAVKFTPDQGQISIRSCNENGNLKVEISDTGIGIAPEVLPHVFNPFEQGEKTITRFFGGLGLGLSIAKAIVELHHGRLTAASAGKNKGATFTVELAAIPGEPPPSLPRPGLEPGEAQKPKILLVDDHVDTLETMAKLLRRLGYDVTTATNVRSALEQAARKRFDLIISDLGLPDGSGLDIMREAKKRYPIHAIALSGFGTEEDIRQSREAGFEEHIVKPVSMETLRETIRRVVSKAA